MQIWRRVRGLLGSAITWGAVGAGIGATMFIVRYRPWPSPAMHWDRAFALLGAFVEAGALWGSACGLAFGVAVWSLGRRAQWQQMSAGRFTRWGAIAGAAFPVLLYTPVVVRHGAFSAIPFYSMLTVLSALAGAACARAVFALAKRAPALTSEAEPLALGASSSADVPTVTLGTRERVR